MLFKYFYEQQKLDEASINTVHGQAVEGIFAIALAVYIAHGKRSSDQFESEIESVRTNFKAVGNDFKAVVDNDITNNLYIHKLIGQKPDAQDKIMVKVTLEWFAKAKYLQDMFGEGTVLPKAVSPFLKNIVSHISSDPMKAETQLKSLKRINDFIEDVLTNNESDQVVFTVSAVGSGGGKSDVVIYIDAETNEPTPRKLTQKPIGFSIKTRSDKTTSGTNIHNGSLPQVILKVAQDFGLPMVDDLKELTDDIKFDSGWRFDIAEKAGLSDQYVMSKTQDPEHFFYYVNKFVTPVLRDPDDENVVYSSNDVKKMQKEDPEKANQIIANFKYEKTQAAQELLSFFVTEFENKIDRIENKDELTKIILDIIEHYLFGPSRADFVSIGHKDIEEITNMDYNELRSKIDVEYEKKTGESGFPQMIFYDSNTGWPLLTLQTNVKSNIWRSGATISMFGKLGSYFKNIGSTN